MIWCNGEKCFEGSIESLKRILQKEGYVFGMVDFDCFQAKKPGEEYYKLYQDEHAVSLIPEEYRNGYDL